MIRGLLIYNAEEIKKNKWFINTIINKANNYNLSISLVSYDDNLVISDVDFIINRSRNFLLSRECEAGNITCFNNSYTCEAGNDKWKTYCLCKRLNIPVMNTYAFNSNSLNITYPYILKSVNGHGGSEVFLIRTDSECKNIINKDPSKKYIIQDIASELGLDNRIYMIGSRIVCSVLRRSSVDFRSNFSLGGSVELYSVSPFQRDMCYKLQNELHSDYIAIDFIMNNGNWVLNEIEDTAGARMLYSVSNVDICDLFLRQIKKTLKEKQR